MSTSISARTSDFLQIQMMRRIPRRPQRVRFSDSSSNSPSDVHWDHWDSEPPFPERLGLQDPFACTDPNLWRPHSEVPYCPLCETHPRGILTSSLMPMAALFGRRGPAEARFVHRGYVCLVYDVNENHHWAELERNWLLTTGVEINDSSYMRLLPRSSPTEVTLTDIEMACRKFNVPYPEVRMQFVIPPREIFDNLRRVPEWYDTVYSSCASSSWKVLVLYIDFYLNDLSFEERGTYLPQSRSDPDTPMYYPEPIPPGLLWR